MSRGLVKGCGACLMSNCDVCQEMVIDVHKVKENKNIASHSCLSEFSLANIVVDRRDSPNDS